nr:hypothetical protein [Tanacetum cinerariifolium]
MTTSVGNNSVFKSFFEKQKLTGPNFVDWYRQLRLVLSIEDKENYLEHLIPTAPVAPPGQQVPPAALAAHAAWVKGKKKVVVLMLLTMDLEIQRNIAHLEFHTSKPEEVSLILVSLNKDFDSFVQNYNMHGMGKTVNELHAMLKLHEETLPKKDATPALHAIQTGRVQKNQKNKSHKAGKGSHGKGKGKMGNASNNASFTSKPITPPPPKKDNPAKDAICHQCGEVRHWRRNCPMYLAELMKKKKLSQGASTSAIFTIELYSFPSDGHRIAVEAIATYNLKLLSRLVIVLNNCHYVPSITRGVILVSRLFDDGFINRFDDNNVISVSKNNLVYFKAVPRDGKMARKPYSHQVERAKDLLGLIHTDLLKQKHEVFETFKAFQKEVENQLGKTIKSLRSDRRGKYMSQEFLDHLKEHRIIAHRTPPYTSQHNGMSERRNRTLLDMVRSMMSQTTLPKSFWDYALETTECILNMVPTKKVDKTPYEIWHEQAPNPSENKVFVARNAEFFESKLLDMKASGSVEDLELIQEEDTNPSGFTQTYGVDYEETFSSVVDIRAIRILIAIAAYYDYEIWQMDVKTAFLNGHLFEEVYMEQPEASGSYIAILILYVDDILLMGNNIPMLQDVKSYLGRSFAMKHLGETAYILGIKIYRDRSKRLIGLCQRAYIKKILKRFYMENSKRGTIPMQEKLKLSKSQGTSTPAEKQRMQNIPYASAIGSIMYAVRCTRPDVAFAQNMTSRFQQNLSEEHWTLLKIFFKFLQNTKDMFLVYGGNMERELSVSCYTDDGYLTDADNLKSQAGYVLVLNRGAVDWKSTKQSIFATSSTDAEYIAAFDASKEAVWIHKFISGLGNFPTIKEPISMYCDNTGAIAIAKDDGVTKGARHFRAKVHYLR